MAISHRDLPKFAVFASGIVGIEAIKLFADCVEQLKLVVLDHENFKGMNDEILSLVAKYDGVRVCYYNQLDIDEMRSLCLDLGILAWWKYKIIPPLLEIPKVGFLNTHPSLLPYCRGKHPNFWAIVNSEPFGVTFHLIDTEIDTGPILFQEQIHYTWEDTGESLYNKSIELTRKMLRENKEKILNLSFDLNYQNPNEGSFHWAKDIDKKSCIDLDKEYKARDILNLIRARTFKPHPSMHFCEGDEIFDVRIEITKRSGG